MYLVCYSCRRGYRVHQDSIDFVEKRPVQTDMFTIYGAGVVRRYLLPNALIRGVGSLLIAKSFGNIRTSAHPGSKYGRTKKG